MPGEIGDVVSSPHKIKKRIAGFAMTFQTSFSRPRFSV